VTPPISPLEGKKKMAVVLGKRRSRTKSKGRQ
jgi:hypothetical protein